MSPAAAAAFERRVQGGAFDRRHMMPPRVGERALPVHDCSTAPVDRSTDSLCALQTVPPNAPAPVDRHHPVPSLFHYLFPRPAMFHPFWTNLFVHSTVFVRSSAPESPSPVLLMSPLFPCIWIWNVFVVVQQSAPSALQGGDVDSAETSRRKDRKDLYALHAGATAHLWSWSRTTSTKVRRTLPSRRANTGTLPRWPSSAPKLPAG